jgi:uncharacterized membrane protein HdeD (DUF308 family)
MSTSPPAAPEPLPTIPWICFVLVGVVCTIVGLIGIVDLGMAYALTAYSVLLFGILMSIAGVAHIIGGFFMPRWYGVLLKIACGILYLAAGIFAIVEPLLMAQIYTFLIAISLIANGMIRLALAFVHRQVIAWLATALAGIITIAVGIYILRRWPWDSAWVIGLFIAIDLLMQGMSWIALGLNLRTVNRAVQTGMPMEFKTQQQ